MALPTCQGHERQRMTEELPRIKEVNEARQLAQYKTLDLDPGPGRGFFFFKIFFPSFALKNIIRTLGDT